MEDGGHDVADAACCDDDDIRVGDPYSLMTKTDIIPIDAASTSIDKYQNGG